MGNFDGDIQELGNYVTFKDMEQALIERIAIAILFNDDNNNNGSENTITTDFSNINIQSDNAVPGA